MGRLLQVFWSITILRAGPQVLPDSSALLWLALVAHWLVGVVLALFAMPAWLAAVAALVGTLVMVAVIQGLLTMRRFGNRFLRTATALAGGEVILGLLMVPVSAWFHLAEGTTAAAMLSLLLLGWNVALAAHILRNALEVPGTVAFMGAVGYMFVSIALGGALHPQGP